MQASSRTTTATAADPRQKMSRSATSGPGSIPTAPHPRRSLSEDSRERTAANAPPRSRHRTKEKPSPHADVIDKLDYSSLGGGMFHHDGPFDACAPSRNRHKNHKAPVFAFDDPAQGGAAASTHNIPTVDKRLSPLAQATIAAMASSDGRGPYPSAQKGPYPPIANYGAPMPPRKTTLAEAWGKAEPEPFEEFSAGTINRYSPAASADLVNEVGYEGHYRKNRTREAELPPRRTKLPPPQPIALPGATAAADVGDAPSSPTQPLSNPDKPGVKRSKSIMQRIRKMRDNPNVPMGVPADNGYASEAWAPMRTPGVGPVAEEDYATDVPTSRQQRGHQHSHSHDNGTAKLLPGVRPRGNSAGEAYYMESSKEKALPAPPPNFGPPGGNENGGSYFEKPSPQPPQMGRKISIMQKMRGAMGGK